MYVRQCPDKCSTMSEGVRVIYKVAEVAKILGFNERTIRRDIETMSEDVRQMSVECPSNVRHILITKYGLNWLAEKHNINLPSEKTEHEESKDNELVSSLLEQLKQKDIQLSEKDKQISMLMEQAKNYQVLLQGQQMLSLEAPKKSFIKRLFSRTSDKE